MSRYIDADEAIKIINGLGSREYRREKGRICDAIKMLSSEQYIPTADVQEVKHGKWNCYYDSIDNYFGETGADIYCSVCCCKVNICTDYCPDCGARMDGDNER